VWRHEHNHLGLSPELSKELHAIEDYLCGHAEYEALWLELQSLVPRLTDALTRLAYSIATALACGLLSPDAIDAIRESLQRHDLRTPQHPREASH
jgi:hypothetical protein